MLFDYVNQLSPVENELKPHSSSLFAKYIIYGPKYMGPYMGCFVANEEYTNIFFIIIHI